MRERELRYSLGMMRVHLCGTKTKPREELDARLGASPGTGRSLETVGAASPVPRGPVLVPLGLYLGPSSRAELNGEAVTLLGLSPTHRLAQALKGNQRLSLPYPCTPTPG